MTTDKVIYPVKQDKDRPWLPGPPPLRRQRPIRDVLRHHRKLARKALRVPVKRLDVSAGGVHEHLTLYAAPSSPKQQLAPHQLECETLLFHGCSDKVDEALLESFSILGPSVHFSRPRNYFSRQPAVYWTDNLQFAIGWCVFTQTGRWITEISSMPDGLECLIYVSRVNLATIAQQFCAHFVPSPRCTLDEQKLVDVYLKRSLLAEMFREKLIKASGVCPTWRRALTQVAYLLRTVKGPNGISSAPAYPR